MAKPGWLVLGDGLGVVLAGTQKHVQPMEVVSIHLTAVTVRTRPARVYQLRNGIGDPGPVFNAAMR